MMTNSRLRQIRENIEREVPELGREDKKAFFGFAGLFSPLTEAAAILLKVYRQVHGQAMPHDAFRGHFLRLVTEEKPARYFAELWSLSDLDQGKLYSAVRDVSLLDGVFSDLVLLEGELESLGGTGLINLLYKIYLNRVPDAEGSGHWLSTIEKGMSLHAAAEAFANAEEVKRLGLPRRLIVLKDMPEELVTLVSRYRQLQDLELSRLYDLASLIVFIEE